MVPIYFCLIRQERNKVTLYQIESTNIYVEMIKVTILKLLLLLLFSSQTSALQCLNCQDVSDKRDCQNVVSCGTHQECYTNRVIDNTGRNLYSLGCVDQFACSQLSQSSGLGKREISSTYSHLAFSNSDLKRSLVTLCFQCCNNSDGCNINVCGTAVNPCAKNPCVHGTCSDRGNNDFWCTCASGYIGRLCDLQISSPCLSNPCVHGSCVSQASGYACTCDKGYAGKNCDLADPCSHSPCVHGVCTTFANNTFTCTCNSGYTGLLCDSVVSPCSKNPCVHGTCSADGNTFQCFCLQGYIGPLCDTRDPCTLQPCVNGKCSATQSGGFRCTCAQGYTGILCDSQIHSCAIHPCVHGSCTNQGTGYDCKCDSGYTGKNCDREIKDCKDVLDNSMASTAGDGIHLVHLNGHPINVLCDMTTLGGGWTILMNRVNNKQNFEDQGFSSYASGFGNLLENFWIGLEAMHSLTGDGRRYQLRVELTVANGTKYVETYDDFSVGQSKDFVLHVGRYTGTAGDSLSGHNGYGFTNKDIDHDGNRGTNCGVYLHGAWWFHDCYDSCLTCPYMTPGTNHCRSFSWNSLGYCIALKSARMMMRLM